MLSRRFFWGFLAGGAVGFLLCGGAVRHYVVRHQELSRLKLRREELTSRLKILKKKIIRAKKDETFLEMEARRELGVVAPGEVEFRFVSETVPEKSGGDKP